MRFNRRRARAQAGLTLVELPAVPVPRSLKGEGGRKRERAAFTLIELLVVIAIIAVLAALFVPTLKTAMSTAKRVACAGTLHGFGTAIHTYVGDRGYMPPIWERGWYDPPVRDLAGRGRGYTLFGVLRQAGALPAEIVRCPADPRDYTPTEATFYQPIYMFGEDYSKPYDHRYSYGALMSSWRRGDRRMPWSLPESVGLKTCPHEGPLGYEQIPNPTILQLVWDAHIPIFTHWEGIAFTRAGGWDQWGGWYGNAYNTIFRHAQNNWVDWSQGPNVLKADGHVEQWMDWEEVKRNLPDSEDWFSIPWSP